MKRPRLKIALLAIAVFLVGLVVKFPASVGASLTSDFVPGFSAGTATGTIWNGSLDAPRWNGRSIQSLEWDLHALNLLLLEASADIDARIDGENLSATVTASPSGRLEVENLRGNISLDSLARLQLMPANLARGNVLLDIGQLVLDNRQLVAAEGRAQLTNLESMLLKGVALGDYAGTLENADEGIRLTFRDVQAPLELQGTANLAATGSYRTEGTVRPTSETPEKLRQGMQFLGKPDNSGRYRFSFQGRL